MKTDIKSLQYVEYAMNVAVIRLNTFANIADEEHEGNCGNEIERHYFKPHYRKGVGVYNGVLNVHDLTSGVMASCKEHANQYADMGHG